MRTELTAVAGIILLVIGMMLVIAAQLTAGFFLPGVVVIIIGIVTLAVAGIMATLRRRPPA